MDTKFQILWIDDDDEFVEEARLSLEDQIRSLQLVPIIDVRPNYPPEKVRDIGPKYDLLLVDYNLKKNQVGTELISKVRDLSMLPDIVFYSARSGIQEIISIEEKENRESLLSILQKGIYFSNVDHLENIAIDVIKKIIYREEKINGFKGMVLSNVSEFEALVNHIIKLSLTKIDDYTLIENYLSEKIYANSVLTVTNRKAFFDQSSDPSKLSVELEPNRIDIDHSNRTRIMNRILKIIGVQAINYEVYKKEIIDLRNSLSHIHIPDNIDNAHFVFKINETEYELTHELCKSTRDKLISYKADFVRITKDIERLPNKRTF